MIQAKLAFDAIRRFGPFVLIAILIVLLYRSDAALSSAEAERDVALVKLEASNASIDTLAAQLETVLLAQQDLEAEEAARKKAAQEALANAEAAEKWREAIIANLEKSAKRVPVEPAAESCEVSDAVKSVWP